MRKGRNMAKWSNNPKQQPKAAPPEKAPRSESTKQTFDEWEVKMAEAKARREAEKRREKERQDFLRQIKRMRKAFVVEVSKLGAATKRMVAYRNGVLLEGKEMRFRSARERNRTRRTLVKMYDEGRDPRVNLKTYVKSLPYPVALHSMKGKSKKDHLVSVHYVEIAQ